MSAKHMKCCCCPDCLIQPGYCCKCMPKTLCFSIAGASEDCSDQADFDGAGWTFVIDCNDITHHVRMELYPADDYYPCHVTIESYELGYPEDSPHRIFFGDDFTCEGMEWTTPGWRFEPVALHTPRNCRGCQCVCDCICISAQRTNGLPEFGSGKFCYDYLQNAWIGDIVFSDFAEDEIHEGKIEFRPRGEFCHVLDDPECNHEDERCILVMQVPGLNIVDHVLSDVRIDCEERNFDITTTIEVETEDGYDTLSVDMRCAECGEDCDLGPLCQTACPDTPRLPKTLHVAVYSSLPDILCPQFGDPGYPGALVGEYEIAWTGTRAPCELIYFRGEVDYPSTLPGAPEGWQLSMVFLCCGPAFAGRVRIPEAENQFLWGNPDEELSNDDSQIAWYCDPFELHARSGDQFGSDTHCFTFIITE